MSSWSEEQRFRLAWEESLLKDEFPHFAFYDHAQPALTAVKGVHSTSAGSSYSVCLKPTIGYPHEMPKLYITSPCPLYGYGYKTIQSYGTSHSMHVWEADWNGYVKICHCKSEYWTASNNIVGVLMKAFLWLEAFEVHKRTGRDIDAYSLTY